MIYPLREEFFQVTPVKTVLPIPKLVRGLKKTSARLNFSPFSWPTTWGTNFSGDTHKIDPSHSSLSEGIYRKMAITRKSFLQALIFHCSRDLPLEREKVFTGTPKNIPLNLLASGGVPQGYPIPSPEKEVISNRQLNSRHQKRYDSAKTWAERRCGEPGAGTQKLYRKDGTNHKTNLPAKKKEGETHE